MELTCNSSHNGFTTDGISIFPTGTVTPTGTTIEIGDPPTGCTCGPWWGIIPPPPCPYHTRMIQPVYVPVIPVVVPVPMPVPAPLPADMKELAQKYREMADAIDPDGAPDKGVKETVQKLRELLDKLEPK